VIVVRADDDVLRAKAGLGASDDGSDILAAMSFDIEELKERRRTVGGRPAVTGKGSMQSELDVATCDIRRCAVAAGASRGSPLKSWTREIGDVGFRAWRRWNWGRQLTTRQKDEDRKPAKLHTSQFALGVDLNVILRSAKRRRIYSPICVACFEQRKVDPSLRLG
jgi:hypothetical protein